MKEDFLKEHWAELKEEIRGQWDKLDEQDLNLIDGDRGMLIGNLQAAYGWSKADAEQSLREFEQLHLAPGP